MPLSDDELEQANIEELLSTRPSWDEYYLAMAYVAAMRSFDPSSKCGTIIVSKNNRVLSAGYNGPLKNSIDVEIPLTRPEKYYHMLHGEENALLAYSGSYQDIDEGTAYVTGRPCHKCLRMLIQKGIKRIVHSKNITKVIDLPDMEAQYIMLNRWETMGLHGTCPRVEIVEIETERVKKVLLQVIDYIDYKSKKTKEMELSE